MQQNTLRKINRLVWELTFYEKHKVINIMMHTANLSPKQVMEYYLAGLGIVQEKLGTLWKYQKKRRHDVRIV